MPQGGYKDLIAWKKGMELVAIIYDATDGFPSHEQFGLVSQLRRAAVSVPSNIAEGVTAAKRIRQLDELGRILSGLMNSLKDREEPQDAGRRTQD